MQGEPDSGKTEVLCEAALRAAAAGLRVLILGPTGTLVRTYKTKVQHENTSIETIHAAWHICRSADTVVDRAAPSRLRTYDLFIIDAASQIEDCRGSAHRHRFQGAHAAAHGPAAPAALRRERAGVIASSVAIGWLWGGCGVAVEWA